MPTPFSRVLVFAAMALAMAGNYYVYDSIGPVAGLLASQRGFSDTQIGTLNAIYSFPNIFIVLIGGLLIDRYSARSVALATTIICFLGAVLTAIDAGFATMALGRLLFGMGAETMIVAITVALAQWFSGGGFALAFALNLAIARLGSWLADRSPSFAADLYAQGWQPPLWLAAGFALAAVLGALVYFVVDRREARRGTLAIAPPADRVDWGVLLRFNRSYWLIVVLCIAFYSVIFPFRSTFAIKFFQDAAGLTLEDAGRMNSYVFLAAVFATPAFGALVDRFGRHADLMVLGALPLPLSFLLLSSPSSGNLWISTVCLGVSFSLVPAVLWPAVANYVERGQLGTAYGLMTMLQNVGLTFANLGAGWINDHSGASAQNPGGYAPMLLFFGILSLAALALSVLLRVDSGRRSATSSG